MTDENQEVQNAAETAGAEGASAETVLSLSDIQNAVKVIDFAADQGAFRGWGVIEQVLIVRNRLNTFLKAASPEDAKAAEENANGTQETASNEAAS